MHLKTFMLIGMLAVGQVGAGPLSGVSDQDVRKYNLGLGRSVFTKQCLSCHGSGTLDAPRLGAASDWAVRLEQGLPALIQHAINGHGRMPPKGGSQQLTVREVSAAVAYVVDQGRRALAQNHSAAGVEQMEGSKQGEAANGCDPNQPVEQCASLDLQDTLLIQMLWLLSAGES